jgi:hypothetical protein
MRNSSAAVSDPRSYQLLDIIAKKWKCTGTSARLLLLEAMAAVKTFSPPKETYLADRKRDENPDEFIKRIWEPLAKKYEITTSDIRRHDSALYSHWSNWKRYNPSAVTIPTKSDVNELIAPKMEQIVEREINALRSRRQHRRRAVLPARPKTRKARADAEVLTGD